MNKLLVLLILLCFQISFAQKPQFELSSKSKKAQEAYLRAENDFYAYNYENAIRAAEAAIKVDNDFIEAYMLLGTIYFEMKNYEQSENFFNKAIKINPRFLVANYYDLAKVQVHLYKYEEAKHNLEIFIENKKDNIKDTLMVNKARFFIKNCDFSVHIFQ